MKALDHVCYMLGDVLSLLIGKEKEWREIKKEEIRKELERGKK